MTVKNKKPSKHKDMINQIDIAIETYEKSLKERQEDYKKFKDTQLEFVVKAQIQDMETVLKYFHFIKYGEFPNE